MRDKNINDISLKYDLKSLRRAFSAHRSRRTMQQNYFKIFLSQETGASGNIIKKESQKSRPKLKKYI